MLLTVRSSSTSPTGRRANGGRWSSYQALARATLKSSEPVTSGLFPSAALGVSQRLIGTRATMGATAMSGCAEAWIYTFVEEEKSAVFAGGPSRRT